MDQPTEAVPDRGVCTDIALAHGDVYITDLLDELRGHLAGLPAELRDDHGPALPIFPTGTGGHYSDSNVRNRLLAGAVKRANEKRAAEGRCFSQRR